MSRSEPNYRKLVPTGSFIASYMDIQSELETSVAYDFWEAVWLISSAVGRHVFVNRPRIPVFLNTFILLVAESGITRKSTAIRMASKLFKRFNKELPENEQTYIIEASTTAEQLESMFSELYRRYGRATIAISIAELVNFLPRKAYTATLPGLLTDLYDCPDLRSSPGTLTRGPLSYGNVYLTFTGACAPSWLARAITPEVIEGGFTSRCLFIHSELPKRRVDWPTEAKDDLSSESVLCSSLIDFRRTGERVQRIEVSEGGLAKFGKWYRGRKTTHGDPFRSSFESREDAHVLRLAALLAINDGSWAVQAPHILNAIRIIDWVKNAGARIFEGTGDKSQLAVGLERLRDALILGAEEMKTQTELLLSCRPYMNAQDMKIALLIMHEMDMVERFTAKTGMRGAPTTRWRMKRNLVAPGAFKAVIEKMER